MKVGIIHYEAHSCERSSPDAWFFDLAKHPDGIADYCPLQKRGRNKRRVYPVVGNAGNVRLNGALGYLTDFF